MWSELRIGSWKLKDSPWLELEEDSGMRGWQKESRVKPKKATWVTTATATCRTILLLKCINQQFARCFPFFLFAFPTAQGVVWQHDVREMGKLENAAVIKQYREMKLLTRKAWLVSGCNENITLHSFLLVGGGKWENAVCARGDWAALWVFSNFRKMCNEAEEQKKIKENSFFLAVSRD